MVQSIEWVHGKHQIMGVWIPLTERTEFNDRGLKSHSGHLSIVTSKMLQRWIACVSIHSTNSVIASARFRLKQMWRLAKAVTKMICEHWTKRCNWSSCTMLALRMSWNHGLMAQLVRESERNSVVVGSNTTQTNFLQLLQKSFSREYHIYTWYSKISIFGSKQCVNIGELTNFSVVGGIPPVPPYYGKPWIYVSIFLDHFHLKY